MLLPSEPRRTEISESHDGSSEREILLHQRTSGTALSDDSLSSQWLPFSQLTMRSRQQTRLQNFTFLGYIIRSSIPLCKCKVKHRIPDYLPKEPLDLQGTSKREVYGPTIPARPFTCEATVAVAHWFMSVKFSLVKRKNKWNRFETAPVTSGLIQCTKLVQIWSTYRLTPNIQYTAPLVLQQL